MCSMRFVLHIAWHMIKELRYAVPFRAIPPWNGWHETVLGQNITPPLFLELVPEDPS